MIAGKAAGSLSGRLCLLDSMNLTVTEISIGTEQVRVIRLARPAGEPLPSWEPGAHIKIDIPGDDTRSYSLVNSSADPAATLRPNFYLLGVRLEEQSRGGSRFMHQLQVGDHLAVSLPANNFPLLPSERDVVLVAGGIGVTPILSMTAALAAGGRA